MSLPSINFLHLTVSEVQPRQTFSLKGCGVKSFWALFLKEEFKERLISNVKEEQLQYREMGALPYPSENEGGFCRNPSYLKGGLCPTFQEGGGGCQGGFHRGGEGAFVSSSWSTWACYLGSCGKSY